MPHQVQLSWNASTDATGAAGEGYNVYKGVVPGTEGATPINPSLITITSYTDLAVVAGQAYDYYITFVKNGAESVHSNQVTTPVLLPAAPTNLTEISS
jgi:fibronectin type 3 domain-containing protein